MKKIIILLLLILPINGYSKNIVALIHGRYEKLENLLSLYKINFDVYHYKDLEEKSIFQNYNVILFPCGIEPPISTSISLESQKSKIQSVTLNKKYCEPDKALIAKNIKNFIEDGGYAYFSGYSFKFIQMAFEKPLKFFKNFPYTGVPENLNIELLNDLKNFSNHKKQAVYIKDNGWIVVKSARDSKILSRAMVKTALGEKPALINFQIKEGDGEFLFTSYHNTVFSNIRRFDIFRIVNRDLFKTLEKKVSLWRQKIILEIGDTILPKETFRKYSKILKKGNYTLYLKSQEAPFSIKIFNNKGILIYRENHKILQDLSFKISEESNYNIKIFPLSKKRYTPYSLIIASGEKKTPIKKLLIFYFFILLFVAIGLFFIKKKFFY